MRNAPHMTFGARLAGHQFTKEDLAWIFDIPLEVLDDAPPQTTAPDESEGKVQIGPLDV